MRTHLSKNNKTSILFVNHFKDIAGAELSMLDLAKGLKKEGFRVAILAPSGGKLQETIINEGLEYLEISPFMLTKKVSLISNLKIGMLSQRVFNRQIKTWKPDIIVANSIQVMLMVSLKIFKSKKFKLIWYLRYEFKSTLLNKMITRFVLRHADYIVVISKSVNKNLSKLLGKIKTPPVKLIYNGIKEFDISNQDFCKEEKATYGIPLHGNVIINIGQFCARKNQIDLIKALPFILKEQPETYILFVGEGLDDEGVAYGNQMKKTSEELKVGKHIRFVGWKKNISEVIFSADILVHTATSEAFGRVLVEAMLCKIPVIAYDIGGVNEIVVSNETGLLIPKNNIEKLSEGILSLLESQKNAKALGLNGYERALNKFSSVVNVKNFKDIIDNLV